MSRARLIVILAAVVLALGAVPNQGHSQPVTTQQAEKLSRKELRLLIAGARTANDHERIAAYYRAESERLNAKAEEEKGALAEYLKNPSGHPVPKWPPMDQQYRQLAYYYTEKAQKAFVLAGLHEQMAEKARQDQNPH